MRTLALFLTSIILASCDDGYVTGDAQGPPGAPATTELLSAQMEVVADGLIIPWGIEIIGENEYLLSERMGDVYHYRDGQMRSLEGIPESFTVEVAGLVYGGIMDVSLHPGFAENRLVYFAYVNPQGLMSVARFRLGDQHAEDLEVIFESDSFSIGSRIAWLDEDHFLVTQGVGGNPYPEPGPQDLSSDAGKIHRLHADGSVPADNPVFVGSTRPTSIWSYGHRDPQGLWVDPEDGTVYSHEHGPLGGDELNIIRKAGNYGWPIHSYGVNYNRTEVTRISQEEAERTTVLPIQFWGEGLNVAPSGLERLEGSLFPEWDGYFLIGSLPQERLIGYNAELDDTVILLDDLGRVRDVAQLPSGAVLLLIDTGSPRRTDSGRVVKLTPR
ncbi:MAG: PQQ-dependent sugar dehydrogenase [Rhodothermales bacterium]|nr:PQQ-dependent sugar dehydrogenase [Rhodothermales bacterium]MBO6778077.1 PQQ-dependent sugar dehydrogenase [Rhodothermales bacterium]